MRHGGNIIGKTKIYGLKFADDVVSVLDTLEGLHEILRRLEKFRGEIGMENTKKTKVMVCRNRGRLGRGLFWEYRTEELEVVNECKYLGFWFTTKGGYGAHLKKMTLKAQTALNATWGLMKRARLSMLPRR